MICANAVDGGAVGALVEVSARAARAGARAAVPPPGFVETAQRVAGAFAQEHEGMFARYGDVSWRDIQSEGVRRALVAWPRYDPARSAVTTFVQMCTKRAMLDLLRGRSRSAAREDRVRGEWERGERQAWSEDAEVVLEGEELVNRAAAVFEATQREMRCYRIFGRGRRGYSVATRAALLAVMRNQELGPRAMAKLLRGRADLRRAVGIRSTPDHKFFARLGKSGAKLRKRLVGVVRGVEEGGGGGAGGTPVRGTRGGRRVVEVGEGRGGGIPGGGGGAGEPGWSGWRTTPSETRAGQGTHGGTGMVRGTADATASAIALRGPLISSKRTAELLDKSLGTLKEWRRRRRHLAFVRNGPGEVQYFQRDVERLAASLLVLVEPVGVAAAAGHELAGVG